jgi:hypothetical protein
MALGHTELNNYNSPGHYNNDGNSNQPFRGNQLIRSSGWSSAWRPEISQ